MKLGDFIDRALILQEAAESRQQAVEKLSALLHKQGCVSSAEVFRQAVARHEAEAASELSPQIAIPHATSDTVLRPAVAMGRTADGQTVFLIASDSAENHIRTLSELAGVLLDGENAAELFDKI